MKKNFDFDMFVDRQNTSSMKWRKYEGRRIIPLWVADMDFLSPPAVLDALRDRVGHGVFGYTMPPDSLVDGVCGMYEKEYRWRIDPEWLVWLPGLVCGLNVTCRAVGGPGDAVATFTPIYPPFMSAPVFSGRKVVKVPLQVRDGRWLMDADVLRQALTPETRLLLLCNPQNPTGRVFLPAELAEIMEVADRHDLIVCSDEIHSGLVLDEDKEHVPLAMLSPEFARRTIMLDAPSKTYNIPGLGCSFAVISDPDLRGRFKRAMQGIVPHVNLLGFAAAEAAYRHGGPWRRDLLSYLRGNRDLVADKVAAMPGLRYVPGEGTYLAWIDVRAAGIDAPGAFFEEAGVGLSDGRDFGLTGFVRLNFGCRRELLVEALDRMRRALSERSQVPGSPAR